MNTYLEYSKSKCFDHKADVMLEDEPNGYFSYAQMINYSDDEMVIGSDMLFKLGTKIKIIFDKPLHNAALKTYHVKVKWCKERSIVLLSGLLLLGSFVSMEQCSPNFYGQCWTALTFGP